MKKPFALVLFCVAVLSLFASFTERASARPAFNKEFQDMYFKKVPNDPKEKSLAEAIDKAKCNVCHVGKQRKDRNSYGQELSKLLNKNDLKDVPKIQDALKKVEAMPSDPANPQSPTFGDRMKEGKLPTGDPAP